MKPVFVSTKVAFAFHAEGTAVDKVPIDPEQTLYAAVVMVERRNVLDFVHSNVPVRGLKGFFFWNRGVCGGVRILKRNFCCSIVFPAREQANEDWRGC